MDPVRPPSWIVFAAPVVIGVALALIMGTWWFLLLSLAGPLTAILTLRFERRRYAREYSAARRTHRRNITQTLEDLAELLRAYGHRLDTVAYSGEDASLTDRDDFLVLGTGTCRSTVTIRLPRDPHARSVALRRLPPHHREGDTAFLLAHDVPILIDRRLQVRITGPQQRVEAIVRSLVADHLTMGGGCLADGHIPEFAGLADPASSCRVMVNHHSGTTSYTVAAADSTPEHLVDIICGGLDRTDFIRIPDLSAVGSSPSGPGAAAARTSMRALSTPVSGPARVHAVGRANFFRLLATITPRTGSRRGALPAAETIRTTAVSDILRQWDATGRHGSGPLAVPVGLPAARPQPPDDNRTRGRTPAVPRQATGEHPSPLFLLDLRASGPHALVAGTTGSGKSVLLETWLEALCRTHSSDELRLVLLDFKGGASLTRFLSYPHTDCVVTDLDEHAALRAVRSITAEIKRREYRLADAGFRDIDALLAAASHDPSVPAMPRLVIVIDEFHVLTSLSPQAVAEFEHLTAVGRSLGVHIVLATQRPSGVISGRMRANISLRICLRVRDESDSHEVLGIPDAAWIDARVPGTALVSDDAGVTATRSAVPDVPDDTVKTPPHIVVRSLADDTEEVLPLPDLPPVASSVLTGEPGPRHDVIAPPLPDHLLADVQDERAHTDLSFIGLVDLPDDNRVSPAHITPASGSFTVSGGRGRGWTTAIHSLAVAFHAARFPVIHLGTHDGFPHIDVEGILRVGHGHGWMIDHLITVCEETRTPAVWAIDDWDEFVSSHQLSPRVERLERLLTGSAGARFVVSGHRRSLAQRLAQIATTRIVFPPASDTDAVFFGLKATRFTGDWPAGRAVILGQESLTDDREGADLQLVKRPQAVEDTRTDARAPHPLWTNFTPPAHTHGGPEKPQAELSTKGAFSLSVKDSTDDIREGTVSIPVGIDPAGATVPWRPDVDGNVLSVTVGEAEDTGLVAFLAQHLAAHGVAVVVDTADAGQRAAADAAATEGRPVCIVSGSSHPSRTGLPPRMNGNVSDDRGPVLLLGVWQEPALRSAGYRNLSPIPAAAHAWWWITRERSIPIRLHDEKIGGGLPSITAQCHAPGSGRR